MATVVGLFDNLAAAQEAVNTLVKNGFKRYEISVMANATSNEYARYFAANSDVPATPITASKGAEVGVMGGVVTGLIVGLAALVIPGIGPIIAAGPLLTVLASGAVGAATGAATGTVVGALINVGVPEDEATVYAESIRHGGTLVLVRTTDENLAAIKQIMYSHEASKVAQQQGDQQTDPTLVDSGTNRNRIEFPIGSTTFAFFEDECRRHFAVHYGLTTYTFQDLRPFYEYGFNLASDPRYLTATWPEVEADANYYWAENNPNDSWGNYSKAVAFGWDCVRRSAPVTTAPSMPVVS